jgi:hypothetical protein
VWSAQHGDGEGEARPARDKATKDFWFRDVRVGPTCADPDGLYLSLPSVPACLPPPGIWAGLS